MAKKTTPKKKIQHTITITCSENMKAFYAATDKHNHMTAAAFARKILFDGYQKEVPELVKKFGLTENNVL